MRHLLAPACLLLLTFTGSADPEAPHAQASGDAEAVIVPVDRPIMASLAAPIPALDDSDAAVPSELFGPVPLPPRPKPVVHRSHQEICDALVEAARFNDLPAPFVIRILFQESRFNAGVVSSAGAEGIAQFMPETSADIGLDNPFDPLEAIPASARHLRSLYQQFGNLGLAAAAYNAGPRRIQDWLASRGRLPNETQGYVRIVTGRSAETWTEAGSGVPVMKLPRHAPCQDAAGLLAWDGPEQIPLPPSRGAPTPAFIVVAQNPPSTPPPLPQARPKDAPAATTTAKDANKTSGKDFDKRAAKAAATSDSKPAATADVKTTVRPNAAREAGKASLQLAARERKETPATR